MRFHLFFFPFSFFLVHALPAHSQPTPSDVMVSISVSLDQPSAGGKGTVAMTLTPGKDLYIKANPAPEFTPDTAGAFRVASALRFMKTSDGHLDTHHPLAFDFSIPDGTPAGTYRLTGTLRWFLCSDGEGWCRMDRRTMSVQFVVAR
jgi:hypothetical protein